MLVRTSADSDNMKHALALICCDVLEPVVGAALFYTRTGVVRDNLLLVAS